MTSSSDLNALISRAAGGDATAESELFERLYQDLRQVARRNIRGRQWNRTIGVTALVNEAYVRLQPISALNVSDRNHLLALAARVMRHVLVDDARARHSQRRGSGAEKAELVDAVAAESQDDAEMLALQEALEELERVAPRQARLVELRYFGGYTIEEAATLLSVAARTARRDWVVARTWLKGRLRGQQNGQKPV